MGHERERNLYCERVGGRERKKEGRRAIPGLIALITFSNSTQQASEWAVARERSIPMNAGLCMTEQLWKKSIGEVCSCLWEPTCHSRVWRVHLYNQVKSIIHLEFMASVRPRIVDLLNKKWEKVILHNCITVQEPLKDISYLHESNIDRTYKI